jgi:hypothetical protein
MSINNTALFDAALATIADSNGAWITSPATGSYVAQANAAVAVATEIDAAIPAIVGGATISQRNLLVAITKSVMEGRSPTNTSPTTYAAIATAIGGMFGEYKTRLLNNDVGGGEGGGGIPAPDTSHIIFVSPAVPNGFGSDSTGDGTMSKPYATIAHAQSTITSASLYQMVDIVLFPGTYTENVEIMVFTRLVGWDASMSDSVGNPAIIDGTLVLVPGAYWQDPQAVANVTNVTILGSVSLNYIDLVSNTGRFSFTNCTLSGYTFLLQGVSNITDFWNCWLNLGANFTQTGGVVNWFNTSSNTSYLQLTIEPAPGNDCVFHACGGGWAGPVLVTQNGLETELCEVVLEGFSCGKITKAGTVTNQPTITAPWGCVPENVVMSGSSRLDKQMRVFQQLTVPSDIAIGAAGTTDIVIPLAASILGESNIASLVCICSMIGTLWHPVLIAQDASVTWVFEQTGGVNNIHCLIYTPGAGFNTGAGLDFNFYAWRPG